MTSLLRLRPVAASLARAAQPLMRPVAMQAGIQSRVTLPAAFTAVQGARPFSSIQLKKTLDSELAEEQEDVPDGANFESSLKELMEGFQTDFELHSVAGTVVVLKSPTVVMTFDAGDLIQGDEEEQSLEVDFRIPKDGKMMYVVGTISSTPVDAGDDEDAEDEDDGSEVDLTIQTVNIHDTDIDAVLEDPIKALEELEDKFSPVFDDLSDDLRESYFDFFMSKSITQTSQSMAIEVANAVEQKAYMDWLKENSEYAN